MQRNAAPVQASNLRVCYFGTYRSEYSRNRVLIQGLRRNGVEVTECHVPLWRGIQDRVEAASGGWLSPAFLVRVARAYARLITLHRKVGDYDVMLLGYPGQVDVCLARLLTWARRRPLALDVFMSTHLIATERGLVARHPVTGRIIYWLEKLAYQLPDVLIQDTPEYVEWLCSKFRLKPARFRLVPTGADDGLFHPVDRPSGDGTFRVVYYGSFIPNHGVDIIVGAARLLQTHPGIRFELIGDGPERADAERKVRAWGLSNVVFLPWQEQQALVKTLGGADLCLGAFGTTPQSLMTVHNKIYEALAMRLCVVTGDSPAIRRAFRHQEELWLCARADAGSLSEAITTLQRNPALRAALAEQGHRAYLASYTVSHLGERLAGYLSELAVRERL